MLSFDAVALDLREDTNAITLEDDTMSAQIVECRKVDIDMPDIGCVVVANLLEERGYVFRGGVHG